MQPKSTIKKSVIAVAVGLAFAVHGRTALALPEGGQVSAGQGSIGAPANGSLVIKQDSQRLALDWLRFGIRAGESVRFDQPGASAIALNRVLGNEASHIYGSLSANGQVFLLNPNGVLFAPGSQVNVGGLVASTLNLSNEDFLAGRYVFAKGAKAGTVVNQGEITAGYAALLGPQVSNEGIITATLGTVALAAGEQITLNLNGTSLVGLTVDKGALDALAANKQLIRADGGTVIMTAKATDEVLRNVVNHEGIIEAGTLSQRDGVIRLESTGSGIVSVDGTLKAHNIAVTGDKVGLFDGARLEASAEGGGGTILIGGNYQGRGPERNASATFVAPGATLSADAIGNGDGGKVIVWADDVTRFYGAASARGGNNSGDGGFVEVSGKDTLVFKGAVDTRAPRGKTGMLLLDPANIVISNGINDSTADGDALNNSFSGVPSGVTGSVAGTDNPVAGTLTLFESELEGIAAATSISLAATGNITINNLTDNLLNLAQTAGNSVTFTAGGTFAMTVGDTIQTAGGALNVTAPGGATLGALATAGGAITLNVGAASTAGGVISGAGTSLTKQGAGTLTLSGNNTYAGATNINAGTLALGAADERISNSSAVTVAAGAIFNLGTFTETIGSLAGAGTVTKSGAGTDTLTVGGDNTSTAFFGVIQNPAGILNLTKAGAGTLTLSGANTYTGVTRINAGVLSTSLLANGGVASNIGASTNAAANLVLAGGTLLYTGPTVSTNRNYTLIAGTTSTLDVTTGGTALTISGASTATTGALTKAGPGTLTLSGANLYTGLTTVNAGTLRYGANNALATGPVTVNDGGSYDLAGFSDSIGALTVNSGATGGAVTTGAGTLTLTGNITSGGGAANASIAGNLAFGATRTITTTAAADGLTVSAAISGAGGLTKAGAGTLTLSGANTYTGVTRINAGVLSTSLLANGGVASNIGASTNAAANLVLAGGTLLYTGPTVSTNRNYTLIAGTTSTLDVTTGGTALTISGASTATTGALTKAGPGTLTLSGANLYTGLTTVNAGTLRYGANNALATGPVTVNDGGSYDLAGFSDSIGALTVNSGATGGAVTTGAGTLTLTGNITSGGGAANASIAGNLAFGATRTITTTAAADGLTVSAAISGAGGLTKAGAGTLTLSGTNTFTGLTTVSAGTLSYGANDALATGAVTVAAGGTYDLAGFSDSIGALTVNSGVTGGAVTTGAGTLTLTGNITSGGGAANASIAGNLAFGATRTITTTAAADGLMVSAAISGAGGLTKAGAGTLTLSGANTYTGTTAINAGTLRLAGGSAIADAGVVTLANVAGAILDLNGTSETIGSLAGGGAAGGNVTLGAATLSTGGNNTTTTYTGVISGTGGLTKQGTGTMTLSGNNSYTGATTVNTGTLTLGAANRIADASALSLAGGATFNMAGFAETLGSIAGAGNITMGAGTLSAGGDNSSTAFSGVISGTGGLTKQGTGTLTLSGANTYTGATAVGAGTLVAANDAALGTTAGGATVANGATLEIANGVAIGAEALNVSGAGVGANGALVVTAGAASYAGAVTFGASASMGGNGSLTLSGVVNDVAAGTSTLTQTGSGTLTLSNTVGSTNALAAVVTSAGQTTAIDGGSVRTTGAQTYGGTVTTGGATTLTSTGGGNITANHANNDFNGNLAISTGGTASIVDSNALDLGVSSVGSLTAQALSGDLTLNGAITATAAGDSIVLAAGGNFDAGAFSLNPGAGRWLVYSTDPASDVRGGLVYNFKHYGLTFTGPYGGPGTGNGFIYSVAPQITPSLVGSTSKVYDGDVAAALAPANYATSGAIDLDTVTLDNPATGAYDDRNVGTTNVTATVAIASATNGAASVYGYTLASTSASGNIGVINQRPITVSALSDSRTYDGSTSSAGVPTISLGTLAPVGGDSAAFIQSFDNRNAGTGKTLTPAGAVADGNGGANYLVTFITDSTGVINQRPITVSAASDSRTYDGSTSSAAVPTISLGTLAPVGGDSAAFIQSFDNRNAGSGKSLTPAGAVADGNGGANYLVTFLTDSTGVINQRSITVSALTDTKTYDGATSSAAVPTITAGSLAPVGGDSAAFIQSFDNRNAGTGKTLTPTGAVADGNGGANYLVTFVTDSSGFITQRAITVSALTDTKTYDGATSSAATPTITAGSLAPVGGDTTAFTQSFDNRNAGTGKTLTPTGAVADGNGGANYLVTFLTDSTGVINQRSITVSALTDTKTYDGATSSAAVPTITAGSLAPVGGDTTAFTQSFDNRNAGSGKTLTPAGAVADGNGGANYLVTFLTDSTGVITQRPITVSAVSDTRTYDGSTSSAATPTITAGSLAPVGGDTTAFTQSFDNRNAGSGKSLTPAGAVADGNGGANYLVTFLTDSTGVINQRSITVSALTDTKTYDGATSSAATPTITAGSLAPVGGDTTAFTQSFDNRNAGAGKTLTPAGAVSDGNGGANYLVSFLTDTSGVITQRPITVSALTDTKTYDGTTSSSVAPLLAGALFDPLGTPALQSFDTRNVGTGKTLTPSGLVVNDGNSGNNYAITYVPANVGQIDAAALTVTADAGQTKVYGSADPALTYSITAGTLFGADTLAGALARAAGENVGAYGINQGTLANANYAISFAGNSFGVTSALLTISADNQIKLVGTPIPPFSATYTGFVLGDTAASLGGALMFSTPANSASAPGAYPVTPFGQTSTNYTITFIDGLLTVSAGAPLQVYLDTLAAVQSNRVAATLPIEYSDLVTIEDGGMRLPAGLKP